MEAAISSFTYGSKPGSSIVVSSALLGGVLYEKSTQGISNLFKPVEY